MQFITLKRNPNKTPKDMLLELYDNNEGKIFTVIMSNDWFKKLKECEGILKDSYELYDSEYDAYFINESKHISSKCLLKIEIKSVAGNIIITKTSRDYDSANMENLNTIFYFE